MVVHVRLDQGLKPFRAAPQVKTARWQTLLLVRLQWHRSLSRSGHCTPPLLALLRLAFASFPLVFVAFKLSFWAAPHDLEPDALDFVVGANLLRITRFPCLWTPFS